MNKPNPYRPQSEVEDCTETRDHDAASKRILTALWIGVLCSLGGPFFLIAYYEYHGVGLGLVGSMGFFAPAYLAVAVPFVLLGIALGMGLSRFAPSWSERAARTTACVVGLAFLGIGAALLLNNQLNLAVTMPSGYAVPAFSLVCGCATLATTTVYLALGKKKTQ